MIPKYKTQLRVSCNDGGPSIEALRAELCKWVATKERVDPEPLEEPGSHTLPRGEATVLHEVVGDSEQWAIQYAQQDQKEPISWIVDAGLSVDDAGASVSIAMGLQVEEVRALNVRRRLRPPRLVGQLAKAFSVKLDGALPATPILVAPSDAGGLLERLQSQERTAPIVLVSVDPWSEKPLLQAQELQKHVIGLGEVHVLTKQAAFALTESLDDVLDGAEHRKWLVHSGAVRVFWPGLAFDTDSPFQHPLWMPRNGRLRDRVPQEIFDRLSWASIHRVFPGWVDVPTIQRRRDQETLERQSKTIAADADRASYESAIDRLKRDVSNLATQLSEQESNVQVALANEQAAWSMVADRDKEIADLRRRLGVREDAASEQPESAESAIALAKTEYSATLLFASNVSVESDQDGDYWMRVFAALHGLCKCDHEGRLSGGFEQVITELPRLLSEQGHNSRKPKHKDTDVYRTDPRTGKDIHLRWRLHMISGAPTETESIYWEPVGSGGEKRYLIGVVGRHQ